MGRKGSRLLPFLKSALIEGKYKNLMYEDDSGLIFSITLPHKTKKLNKEDEQIFKDWYDLNGKKYVFASSDYTEAKQAIIASLRKSDYVEKVPKSHNKLIYRILDEAEIKEKKELKKELKLQNRVKKEVPCSDHALSPVESGYASGVDSPLNDNSIHPVNDSLVTSGGNELSEVSNPMETNRNFQFDNTISSVKSEYDSGVDSSLIYHTLEPLNGNLIISGGNDLLQPYSSLETSNLYQNNSIQHSTNSTFSTLDKVPIPEAMDVSISTENALTFRDDTADLLKDFLSNIQPYNDYSSSINCFSENAEYLTPGYDSLEYYKNNELSSSNFNEDYPAENKTSNCWDFLQLANHEDFTASNSNPSVANDDITISNFKPMLANEKNLTNHASKVQNMPNQLTESQDSSALKSSHSGTFKENISEKVSLSQDPDVTGIAADSREKFYFCKKIVELEKIQVLFFEPQFESCDDDAPVIEEIKFVFEEAVLKEIKGFKTVKEYKFINDHLMVVLEPSDD